ncbi:hypothetical protein [Candidatus Venteria ishoeyi]|uniref:Uncharacterized protein n=1 Tax=Candidatus Venteria ishoeyi TaxID=1899563 RepID=A0A1H6FA97_9GAMM|nr:hypothetical protein [Candidatus Venteria ishoeyi]MDM8545029.1 hypothetical protein [Candidatus Venteria ishoeyi]SEH07017.1 Uncharacterised protein [Candidatus Venteria ishoeyi]
MSTLTPEEIAKFEQAMQGDSPVHDPDWKVTQQMLKMVALQGKYIIELQAQLDAYMGANQATSAMFIDALQQSSQVQTVDNQISEADAEAAVTGLSQAVESYQNGQQVAQYAGNVLKFAAAIIL